MLSTTVTRLRFALGWIRQFRERDVIFATGLTLLAMAAGVATGVYR